MATTENRSDVGPAVAPPGSSATENRAEPICDICQINLADASRWFAVREMMFGYREAFSYYQCPDCHGLFLHPIPEDLRRFYPPQYRAFAALADEKAESAPVSFLKRLLRPAVARQQLGERNLLGGILSLKYRHRFLPAWLTPQLNLRLDSSILDVGCGNGALLFVLQRLGFKHLMGVDPFIDAPVQQNHVSILKSDIFSLERTFDFIMMHHSFEHMPGPRKIFQKLAALVKAGGFLLIRIPITDTYGWNHYGVNWVQLDAPRHLCLHTVTGMTRLSREYGLRLVDLTFDSDAFLFYGSEQYRRDIPLEDERSVWRSPPNGPFTSEQMQSFAAQAVELNRTGQGDQASFLFQKPLSAGSD